MKALIQIIHVRKFYFSNCDNQPQVTIYFYPGLYIEVPDAELEEMLYTSPSSSSSACNSARIFSLSSARSCLSSLARLLVGVMG
mmetsp:Transcript_14983/g.29164  ORF Transcript_14983/g.29164 Transcript_14983/m.29164 type:complete len:84 (-) Transcript_14983:1032-1283(-)